MKSPTLLRSLIGVALLFAAAVALRAAIGVGTPEQLAFGTLYLVDSTGDGDLVGSSDICDDGTGHCTLRAAIEASNLNAGSDFIGFNIPTTDPGFSNGTWTINLPRALPDIFDAVSLSGPGADKLIVQRSTASGTPNFRVFNVTTSGTISFSGITITNGDVGAIGAPGDLGGGIQNYNAGTVNLSSCIIASNRASLGLPYQPGKGGGIANRAGGTINITKSTLSDNDAGLGGGIYNGTSGIVNVTTSTFNGFNDAIYNGGGVYNEGTFTLTNSTLTGCNAVNGGGIYNFAGTVNVIRSTIGPFINASGNGAGIYNGDSGTTNVINSTISFNTANAQDDGAGNGGGIYNKATLNVTNSTIARNCAMGGCGVCSFGLGGGIYNDSAGSATIKSTIIAKNGCILGADPDVHGAFVSQGYNLIFTTESSTGFTAPTDQTGTNASPIDPKFALDSNNGVALTDNGGPTQTIALLSGSPAIDKGISNGLTGTLTTDQRGVGYKRTINKSVPNATGGDGTDIGAFEFGAQIKAVSRKTHGTAGIFDIKLPLTGPKLGVECRKGGASGVYKVIMTFPTAVTVESASATPDPNAPGATGNVSSFSVNGSKVTVNLTGVSNTQTILITLLGVSDGTNTNDVSVPMGVLLGDTSGNGSVTDADVTLTQSKVGQTVNKSTFREDVTIDGLIDSKDVQLVTSHKGTALP